MTSRDRDREQRILTNAGHGRAPFIEQARARLEAGEERFGSSWSWIGIPRHLTELMEEAADLGSWAVLADQALDLEHGLSDDAREQIRQALHRAAELGAEAHKVLDAALKAIGVTQ